MRTPAAPQISADAGTSPSEGVEIDVPSVRLWRAPCPEPPRVGETEEEPRRPELLAQSGHTHPVNLSPRPVSLDAWRAARRYVGLCVEVLGGFRPPDHLRRLTSPVDFATIAEHLRRSGRHAHVAGGDPRPSACPPPGKCPSRRSDGRPPGAPAGRSRPRTIRSAAPARRRAGVDRITLRHLRVSEPMPGVAEVAAVLGTGEHARAMALRLELRDQWMCTFLRIL